MKRICCPVKELAQEFGVSHDSVYRAYRSGKIPGSQMARTISVRSGRGAPGDAQSGQRHAEQSVRRKRRATAGGSRRRAQQKRPRSVKRGLV